MDQQKKLLLKMLEITDPDDDKDELADYLLELITTETVFELIRSLPKTRQASAAKKWDTNTTNPAALNSLLGHYFTKKEIDEMGAKVAQEAMQSYLRTIDMRLSDKQRKALFALSEELEKSQ